jgi:hypothetical protein
MMGGMQQGSSLVFCRIARLLAAESRRLGLTAPGFRCPPRADGVDRAIRRYAGGQAVVAVRVRDRSLTAVMEDMVDGVLVTNGVVTVSERGRQLRTELLEVVEVAVAPEVAAA